MKQLLAGIVLFAVIALGSYLLFSGPLGMGQGVAVVAAIVLAVLGEWSFHRFVRQP
ncbi:hypothetical protein [Alteribacter natronophilus]|uniref:hypothetical protein n=1 Tax=Alteribacter natronophilus TaxID=2583810 RepID=UPI0014874584|nr:hypothetical protein [Alteribacter natronophilus]